MRRTLLVLVLLSAGLALLASGCGSDSSTADEASESLTKKQFVKRADAYCTRGYKAQARAMEKYAEKHGFSREPTQAEREEVNTAVVLGFVRRKIEFFKSLPAPEGDEQKVQRMIASMERGLEQSEEDPASLAKPYSPEPFTDTRHLTAEYGPWICGQA
jgi:hypothetical protein